MRDLTYDDIKVGDKLYLKEDRSRWKKGHVFYAVDKQNGLGCIAVSEVRGGERVAAWYARRFTKDGVRPNKKTLLCV
jgi:hypothetical protein